MANLKILVADADAAVREIVVLSAKERGWAVDEARDGIEAIKKMRRNRYAMLILELELPVIDGLMVCEQYHPHSLVIVISRRKGEQDILDAFRCGANDFLRKPFYPRELIARMNNLMKLSGLFKDGGRRLTAGDVEIDLDAQLVSVSGEQRQLSPREFGLITFLCKNPNRVFSREVLLDMVWGADFIGTDRTVDTHIKTLRDKLQTETCTIETVWGLGYKLAVKV